MLGLCIVVDVEFVYWGGCWVCILWLMLSLCIVADVEFVYCGECWVCVLW
jgi:hypothetical protein